MCGRVQLVVSRLTSPRNPDALEGHGPSGFPIARGEYQPPSRVYGDSNPPPYTPNKRSLQVSLDFKLVMEIPQTGPPELISSYPPQSRSSLSTAFSALPYLHGAINNPSWNLRITKTAHPSSDQHVGSPKQAVCSKARQSKINGVLEI